MTLSVTCPEDVINVALARIGYVMRITNIYEGTKAANLAVNIYSQTRDELLRGFDWGFAERNVALTLLKQAPAGGYIPPTVWSPTYPPPPWLFEYAYPDDCLKIRALKPVPLFVPNFDPQPYVFSVENDNSLVPPAKVILAMLPAGILVYTGQITDPRSWEADFVEALAAALGRRLGPALMGLEAIKAEIPDEAQATAMAQSEQG